MKLGKVELGKVNSGESTTNIIKLSTVDCVIDSLAEENKVLVLNHLVNTKSVAIADKTGNSKVVATLLLTINNDKVVTFAFVKVLSALTLRYEINSFSKCMGELRDAPSDVGAWVGSMFAFPVFMTSLAKLIVLLVRVSPVILSKQISAVHGWNLAWVLTSIGRRILIRTSTLNAPMVVT